MAAQTPAVVMDKYVDNSESNCSMLLVTGLVVTDTTYS